MAEVNESGDQEQEVPSPTPDEAAQLARIREAMRVKSVKRRRKHLDEHFLGLFMGEAEVYIHALTSHLGLIQLAESYEQDGAKTDEEIKNMRNRENNEYVEGLWIQPAWMIQDTREYVKRETSQGCPSIYAQALVRLWSILEAKMYDIAAEFLYAFPEVIHHEKSKKLKEINCNVSLFMLMSGRRRARYILDQLKSNLKSSFKNGFSKFEEVFNAMGMGSGVVEEVRIAFIEMAELRHNIVHRNGIADTKLIEKCPWLGLSEGDQIRVTKRDLSRYGTAIKFYLFELERRLCANTGTPWNKFYDESMGFWYSQLRHEFSRANSSEDDDDPRANEPPTESD
jgi:hypothetical protein